MIIFKKCYAKSKITIDLKNEFQNEDNEEKFKALLKERIDELSEINGVYVIPEDLTKEDEIFVSSKFNRQLDGFTGTRKPFQKFKIFS